MKIWQVLIILIPAFSSYSSLDHVDLAYAHNAFTKKAQMLSLAPGLTAYKGGITANFDEISEGGRDLRILLEKLFHRNSPEEYYITNLELMVAKYLSPKLLGQINFLLFNWQQNEPSFRSKRANINAISKQLFELISGDELLKIGLAQTEREFNNYKLKSVKNFFRRNFYNQDIENLENPIAKEITSEQKIIEERLWRNNLGVDFKNFNRALRKLITLLLKSSEIKNENINFHKLFASFIAAKSNGRSDVWDYMHGIAIEAQKFHINKFAFKKRFQAEGLALYEIFNEPENFLYKKNIITSKTIND
jgi:hypothetical protein